MESHVSGPQRKTWAARMGQERGLWGQRAHAWLAVRVSESPEVTELRVLTWTGRDAPCGLLEARGRTRMESTRFTELAQEMATAMAF